MLLATAGDAGIVLSRFFSVVEEVSVVEVGRGVLVVVGATVVLRAVVGLVTVERRAEGRTPVLLAGVPRALRVVVVESRSLLAVGARDVRLGRAAMPSFLSSFLSSPVEASEGRLRCVAVADDGVVEDAGLRTVVGTVGRTGGLLDEETMLVRVVLDGTVLGVVVDGAVREVVGATFGAVSGRRTAPGAGLGFALTSFALSAMMLRMQERSNARTVQQVEK